MISFDAINTLSAEIAATFHPERIILFGSYAYGNPGHDSDVDLLVVMPYTRHSAYQAAAILTRVNPAFPVDVLVRTPGELAERIAQGDFFLREVVERGRELYAAPHR
ncbi:MAG: nucleotidyltransferase domain-containing protein [Chloroflexales bacterium]